MLNERLRRVTDLFIEGTELFFGFEEDGTTPILMWVNKINSFEQEEAIRDGNARRGMRLAELSKEDSDELIALKATMAGWSDDRLAEMLVEQQLDDIYLKVLNDLDSEEEWREKIEMVRRGSSMLDDQGVPEDDPRRRELAETQLAYLRALKEGQQHEQNARIADVRANSRRQNEADFVDAWRKRLSIDVYMQERRVTEIFMSLRDCKGTLRDKNADGTLVLDHTDCDHGRRLLNERSDVYQLPEAVIGRIVDAIDGVTVPLREAGNSAAPESSSASSEPFSAAEEASTPSSPVETPRVVPMT